MKAPFMVHKKNKRAKRALAAIALCLLVLFSFLMTIGCTPAVKKYSDSFAGCFDTVITIVAYTDSETQFQQWFSLAEDRFWSLHRLYDIYQTYPDLNNLCTVNEKAGIAPVQVDQEIIDLLLFAKKTDRLSPGTVNIAFGPVLSIWHDIWMRSLNNEPFSLPAQSELETADRLCDPDQVVIDESAGTVYLKKQGMKLDVGAIAKGYAAELVARDLISEGLTSGIVSAGGSNVRLIGKPADGRDTWQIGIQNPFSVSTDENPPMDVLLVNDLSVATSGDYQRYFEINGTRYHHLIDTKTLNPARFYRSVTVLAPDSGMADYLSTALFLLPYEEGQSLISRLDSCEALWIFPDREIKMTDGMRHYLKSNQNIRH